VPLLQGQPGVGEIFIIKSRKTPFWLDTRQRALAKWLRARGAGPTWFCDPGDVGRNLLRRGNIPDAYVCEDPAVPWVPGEHFVDRWIRFAQMTPAAFEGRLPVTAATVPRAAALEISAPMNVALEQWLALRGLSGRALLLVQAGNKRTMRRGARQRVTNTKYWPEERWAAVIRAMRAERPGHAILLMGVPQEYALNSEIASLAGVPEVHNVADELPIRVLLPLLAKASGLVSVDTGPAHAAAALGCPTVALFGASDSRLYRPGGVSTPAVVLTGEVDGQRSMLGMRSRPGVSWARDDSVALDGARGSG
jgi:heptosyltransferase-2/heptosyltransferase-3